MSSCAPTPIFSFPDYGDEMIDPYSYEEHSFGDEKESDEHRFFQKEELLFIL